MVGVEQWAEVRRLHFVRGLSIREINRRTGLHRETIRRALQSEARPRYSRPLKGSRLDPFKDEIHRLLRQEPRLTGVRVPALIESPATASGSTGALPLGPPEASARSAQLTRSNLVHSVTCRDRDGVIALRRKHPDVLAEALLRLEYRARVGGGQLH